MMLRARRAGSGYAAGTIRKGPLLEMISFADTARVIREGSPAEKIGAIADLSIRLQDGAEPSDECAMVLGEALRDPDGAVRRSAAITLSAHGKDLLGGVCAGLGSVDPQIRRFSAAMIYKVICADGSAMSGEGPAQRMMVDGMIASLDDPQLRDLSTSSLLKIASRSPMMILERLKATSAEGMGSESRSRLLCVERAANDSIIERGKQNPC
ncbi:MAG: hypothetical protein U0R44_04020 [Candidatus Micrarchaeia archaeon]